jgi:hypothetical protein
MTTHWKQKLAGHRAIKAFVRVLSWFASAPPADEYALIHREEIRADNLRRIEAARLRAIYWTHRI